MTRQYHVRRSNESPQKNADNWILQRTAVRSLPAKKEEEKKAENKTGLPDRLKEGIENLSGYDLSGVRVNYNSPKPTQLNALAYTQGLGIEVAPGQERHLPHEAWHVVQQMQGRVRPTMEVNGYGVNGDRGLEQEAEEMGNRARQDTRTDPTQLYPLARSHREKNSSQKESRELGIVMQRQVAAWARTQVEANTEVYHCTGYNSGKDIISQGIRDVRNEWGGGALGAGFYTHKEQDGAINYVAESKQKMLLKFRVNSQANGQAVKPNDYANKKNVQEGENPVTGNDYLQNAEDYKEIKWHGGGKLALVGYAILPDRTFYADENELDDELGFRLEDLTD